MRKKKEPGMLGVVRVAEGLGDAGATGSPPEILCRRSAPRDSWFADQPHHQLSEQVLPRLPNRQTQA